MVDGVTTFSRRADQRAATDRTRRSHAPQPMASDELPNDDRRMPAGDDPIVQRLCGEQPHGGSIIGRKFYRWARSTGALEPDRCPGGDGAILATDRRPPGTSNGRRCHPTVACSLLITLTQLLIVLACLLPSTSRAQAAFGVPSGKSRSLSLPQSMPIGLPDPAPVHTALPQIKTRKRRAGISNK
ncbi:hypothetical protein ZHAS_00010302 [Anopheles sinensis]|uniref:Uncharacterized protein n=1 Tax=Anopheles sinensis TaxID=74873 RepID=A0A084VX91_ANOSI|nr:hypothetical protein ZHAS_00010302 [Anopheles sinensis]